jgi:hypothetical protein
MQAVLPPTFFVDTRYKRVCFRVQQADLAPRCACSCRTDKRPRRERLVRPPALTNFYCAMLSAGNRSERRALRTGDANKHGLVATRAAKMSPILPISFLLTLLCAFGAVEGVLFQQLLFVGAALSATILICSFEAWSAREIPVRTDDESKLRRD